MKWLILPVIIFLFIGCSCQMDEECFCKPIIRVNVIGQESIPITTFMTEEHDISLQLGFENKDEGLDMDFISVNRENYYITRMRKEEDSQTNFRKIYEPILFGWNKFNVTVDKFGISIQPYIDYIEAEYPIREMIIASKYLLSCPRGTPSWEIVKNQPVVVPIGGLSRGRITINSTKEFSPVISIIGDEFHFTLKLYEKLGTLGSKLPADIYHFIIENTDDNIQFTHQVDGCDTKLLAAVHLKTFLTTISITTLDEDYTLILEPSVANTCNDMDSVNIPSNDSFSLMLLTLVCLVVISFTLIIFLVIKLRRSKNRDHSLADNIKKEKTKERITISLKRKKRENSDYELKYLPEEETLVLTPYKVTDDGELKKRRTQSPEQPLEKIIQDERKNCAYELKYLDFLKDMNPYKVTDDGELNKRRTQTHEQPSEKNNLDECLCKSAASGNIKEVQEAITGGADVNCQGIFGRSPLYEACVGGHLTIIQELLQAGVKKNSPDEFGETPLHAACARNHILIVQELLRVGVNKESLDNNGETPLYAACYKGNLHVVQELLKDGTNVNTHNSDGLTPLHAACREGYLPMVQELLRAGCKTNTKDKYGETPLHEACARNDLSVAFALLAAGANKDASDKDGVTPLHLASIGGHLSLVQKLLSTGANKNAKTKDGRTPLSITKDQGHINVEQILIEAGAEYRSRKYKEPDTLLINMYNV